MKEKKTGFIICSTYDYQFLRETLSTIFTDVDILVPYRYLYGIFHDSDIPKNTSLSDPFSRDLDAMKSPLFSLAEKEEIIFQFMKDKIRYSRQFIKDADLCYYIVADSSRKQGDYSISLKPGETPNFKETERYCSPIPGDEEIVSRELLFAQECGKPIETIFIPRVSEKQKRL